MEEQQTKYNIIDEKPPFNAPLRAQYKQGFAYYTVRERLPVILTQVIDQLSKDKETIVEALGEVAREELKQVIGEISKLKYELQTDKEFKPISSELGDEQLWNDFIASLGDSNSYYSACWIFSPFPTNANVHPNHAILAGSTKEIPQTVPPPHPHDPPQPARNDPPWHKAAAHRRNHPTRVSLPPLDFASFVRITKSPQIPDPNPPTSTDFTSTQSSADSSNQPSPLTAASSTSSAQRNTAFAMKFIAFERNSRNP